MTDGTVTIRQTLQRVGGELLIAAPKTQRSARRVALPDECVTALRARRAQQRGDRLAAGEKWKGGGSDLVFTTKNGTPIEPRNLNRAFTLLCDKAGVRRVRFHDLRHTCASLLHEQGADARMIMEVLGHSSIRVTMTSTPSSGWTRSAPPSTASAMPCVTATARTMTTARAAPWSPSDRSARRLPSTTAINRQRKRPLPSLEGASELLRARQDSNLQPLDP
ncbi:tyrosine-type recombinase/integrase [Streptomyces sp. NEAU-S77]|uniref:tyrosine-type recombinase/integrase n=1 Tax=Streptomyces sp. NEAU-S77 TaxID=3411033 RepID=UPI003BA166C2